MIAALYVQREGCYWGLDGVDPWDEERDARTYDGPWPVVAHPPCARWCAFAPLVEMRHGRKLGDDHGTFQAALEAVRKWGGVLEHPARSYAFQRFGLPSPTLNGWSQDLFGSGWVTEVCQGAYGHRAQKRTWLYYVGENPPHRLDWRQPRSVVFGGVEHMGHAERMATPVAFRDLLIGLARLSRPALKENETE